MRVRMLVTQAGAVDDRGLDVQLHEAGRSYDLPAGLAGVYLGEGWACEDKAIPAAPEVKVVSEPDAPAAVVEPVATSKPKGRPRK